MTGLFALVHLFIYGVHLSLVKRCTIELKHLTYVKNLLYTVIVK